MHMNFPLRAFLTETVAPAGMSVILIRPLRERREGATRKSQGDEVSMESPVMSTTVSPRSITPVLFLFAVKCREYLLQQPFTSMSRNWLDPKHCGSVIDRCHTHTHTNCCRITTALLQSKQMRRSAFTNKRNSSTTNELCERSIDPQLPAPLQPGLIGR